MAHARELDGWDPMTEGFNNSNIDSYEGGPGVNMSSQIRATPNTEYKLYVTNVPLELTEEGIRQVFDCHGKTLNVMSPPTADWAFITYGSFREADLAVRMLNKRPPLHMNVNFSIKDAKSVRKQIASRPKIPGIEPVPCLRQVEEPHQYMAPEDHPHVTRPMAQNFGRGRDLAALVRQGLPSTARHPHRETEDLLYPVVHDSSIYDPYEDAEPFADTNKLLTRGRLQVFNDGTRYVNMGRGYTWYQLPTPHPKVSQQIRAVYEKREAGVYEYGENKLTKQIGVCQNCTKRATMRCQRCKEFYCSRACQEADWPRHRVECQPIPHLEVGPETGSLSMSSGEEPQSREPMKQGTRRLRRPLRCTQQIVPPNSCSTPLSGTSPKTGATSRNIQGKENLMISSNETLKRTYSGDQRVVTDHQEFNFDGRNPSKNSDSQTFRRRNSKGDTTETSQRAVVSNKLPLPKQNNHTKQIDQTGTEIALIAASTKSLVPSSFENPNSNYRDGDNSGQCIKTLQNDDHQGGKTSSVSPISAQPNEKEFNVLVEKLSVKEASELDPKHRLNREPDVNFRKPADVPTAFRDESKVQKVSGIAVPTVTQVQSEGVVTDISKDRPVSSDLRAHGSTISFAKLSAVDQNLRAPKSTVISPPKPLENIVELLDEKEDGCFEVHVHLGNQRAAVTVFILKLETECTKICSELTPTCAKKMLDFSYSPKIGDLVCGKRLEDWIRGTVVSLSPQIRVAAIDEGRMETVSAIQPVPKEFANLPGLGAICELTEGATFKLEPMAQYQFVVTNKKPSNVISKDGVEILISSDDKQLGKGFLKPWTPAPEQKGVPYATLTTNTEVHLVSFRGHTILFVRSLVPKDMECFNRMTQDVAKWSTKGRKFVNELPVIGEMVIAKYEDGNFYRAIVRRIEDNNITVSYLDFGNVETTTLNDLQPICDALKTYPSCVARVSLKGVPKDVPMTKEVSEYLCMLSASEKPLMCTFDGNPFTDGVVLKAADGTCLNDKINDLLIPNWKKTMDTTTAFMCEDLPVAELGKVGDTVNVLVLHSYGPLLHAMAPYDRLLIEHITGVMTAQLAEYCNQIKEHYIPRQNELCLAPYEGVWYRAVCMEPNATPTASTINFIDFGNTEDIPHKDLRLITKDFVSTNALASVCQIVGLGPVDEHGDLAPSVATKVMELLPINDTALVKIVEYSKSGYYVVELPEVRGKLINEGLIEV